jgi:O-acetyl-ADP-ribose deacetylase (regulator of RNase III)
MDGGIDKVYADHFRWPYGRPYQHDNPLQQAIDAQYGKFKPLPIGDAILVPVVYPDHPSVSSTAAAVESEPLSAQRSVRFLIAAPTMERPGPIEVGSRIVYSASLAAFRVWRTALQVHGVRKVGMPSVGTGYGAVPAVVAARQMQEAFVEAWR